MDYYIVCRHETDGEVVYGFVGSPVPNNIIHISRDELSVRVGQSSNQYRTATNGKAGPPIFTVDGHLVADYVRTQGNRRTEDNLGELDECDYVHDPQRPLRGVLHNR